MSEKKLNLLATVKTIKAKAGENITDEKKFDEMMKDPDFVLESCLLWGIEPVYD